MRINNKIIYTYSYYRTIQVQTYVLKKEERHIGTYIEATSLGIKVNRVNNRS